MIEHNVEDSVFVLFWKQKSPFSPQFAIQNNNEKNDKSIFQIFLIPCECFQTGVCFPCIRSRVPMPEDHSQTLLRKRKFNAINLAPAVTKRKMSNSLAVNVQIEKLRMFHHGSFYLFQFCIEFVPRHKTQDPARSAWPQP